MKEIFEGMLGVTDLPENSKLKINYTNYKGENADRNIAPNYIWYGESEFHEGKQWFMRALDIDRKVHRDFALKDLTPLEK